MCQDVFLCTSQMDICVCPKWVGAGAIGSGGDLSVKQSQDRLIERCSKLRSANEHRPLKPARGLLQAS